MWKKIIISLFVFFNIGFLINFKKYDFESRLFVAIFTLISVFIILMLLFKKENRNCTPVNKLVQTEKCHTDEYIEDGNVIFRADGKELSNEEIPYLMQVGYERALEQEQKGNNPKFHRTERENELSFQFSERYYNEISLFEGQLEDSYDDALKTGDYQDSIAKLENTLTTYNKFKRFCYSKGKGGTIYFQDMWEYLHNSKNPCFSYESQVKESLNDRKMLCTIMPAVIEVISKNDGFLQKDIYTYLPNYERKYIRTVLKDLKASGKINAEKKGNTYVLTMNK